MSPRERMLAMLVGSTLPLLLVYLVYSTINGWFDGYSKSIAALENQLLLEEDLQKNAQDAQLRRYYYRDHCLPANTTNARIQYKAWLDQTLEKSGLSVTSVNPGLVTAVKFGQKSTVFNQYSWTVNASGNLRQLMSLLIMFNSLEMTHRISAFKVKPLVDVESGKRSGEMKLEFEIQAIGLIDAGNDRDFSEDLLVLDESEYEHERSVLTRNIFGPANTPPSFVSSGSPRSEEEVEISFDVSAKDEESKDGLTLELIESAIPEAEFVAEGDGGKGFLRAPPQKPGKYDFVFRATDDGFPPKSVEKKVTLTVNEKRIVKEDPPKAPFDHAKATIFTAIVTNSDGRLVCWIYAGSDKGKKHTPAIGESFEIGDKKWTVRHISNETKTAEFEIDDKLLTVSIGSRLSEPLSTRPVDGKEGQTVTSAKAELEGSVPEGGF